MMNFLAATIDLGFRKVFGLFSLKGMQILASFPAFVGLGQACHGLVAVPEQSCTCSTAFTDILLSGKTNCCVGFKCGSNNASPFQNISISIKFAPVLSSQILTQTGVEAFDSCLSPFSDSSGTINEQEEQHARTPVRWQTCDYHRICKRYATRH